MSMPAAAQRASASTTNQHGALLDRFRRRIAVNPALSRALVSYQSNRARPGYRWFKYKEGFSAALVEYVLALFGPEPGTLLDPFAGTGAALFASRELGWRSLGIELLPVGTLAAEARLAAERVGGDALAREVRRFLHSDWQARCDPALRFPHLPITRGAFPPDTEHALACYRTYLRDRVADDDCRLLFHAAGASVLEAVSFTRKDGQYLRWDGRAPRALAGRRFHKGRIAPFAQAIAHQLTLMVQDVRAGEACGAPRAEGGAIELRQGSCLHLLPRIAQASVDLVVTSPPYCNRYDYTRTYALELAYLGVDAEQLKALRQALLSCTVENRAKIEQLRVQYATLGREALLRSAIAAFDAQPALHEVLAILERQAGEGELNNPQVPRMVRNYFLESAIVIFELARLVRRGGRVVMVNDNVQYAGQEVPVDLILADLAERAGFVVECIWTLGRGKGNSSQQMGVHGRQEIRKCAYVWRMPY